MLDQVQERPKKQSVWWIDRREHWRRRILCALLSAGFDARAWSSFEHPPVDAPTDRVPDLVIISGARISKTDETVVGHVLDVGHPVIVVLGRTSVKQIRRFFKAGARDVIETSPDPERAVELVCQSLDLCLPVSSYEVTARERKVR